MRQPQGVGVPIPRSRLFQQERDIRRAPCWRAKAAYAASHGGPKWEFHQPELAQEFTRRDEWQGFDDTARAWSPLLERGQFPSRPCPRRSLACIHSQMRAGPAVGPRQFIAEDCHPMTAKPRETGVVRFMAVPRCAGEGVHAHRGLRPWAIVRMCHATSAASVHRCGRRSVVSTIGLGGIA